MRPPYYGHYKENPRAGVRVAFGPTAWQFVKRQLNPTMVLPQDEQPSDRDWPSDGQPALIHERGIFDDDRLRAMAAVLLQAGAPSVVAIREALLNDYDPRVFFDPEVQDAAA
jgi:hypothetical protein